jgi:hypothetical protein
MRVANGEGQEARVTAGARIREVGVAAGVGRGYNVVSRSRVECVSGCSVIARINDLRIYTELMYLLDCDEVSCLSSTHYREENRLAR